MQLLQLMVAIDDSPPVGTTRHSIPCGSKKPKQSNDALKPIDLISCFDTAAVSDPET
jgi:hypothetical protein